MNYEQLIQPNLKIVGTPELCLVYVREVFGVAALYPTAAAAWQNAQYKHTGTPPANAVPIWFSYNQPTGHVAVWNNGTVYSTTAQGDKTFTSIQALMNYIGEGIEYLGWSEDINNVRVVQPQGVDMQPTPKQVGDIYKFMTNADISQTDLDFYITAPRTIYDLVYALGPDCQKKVAAYASLPNATQLAPGLYKV